MHIAYADHCVCLYVDFFEENVCYVIGAWLPLLKSFHTHLVLVFGISPSELLGEFNI